MAQEACDTTGRVATRRTAASAGGGGGGGGDTACTSQLAIRPGVRCDTAPGAP